MLTFDSVVTYVRIQRCNSAHKEHQIAGVIIGSNVPLARWSGLQCYSMGHNCHGINLYGVPMILIANLHTGGHSDRGTLSHSTPGLMSLLYVTIDWIYSMK